MSKPLAEQFREFMARQYSSRAWEFLSENADEIEKALDWYATYWDEPTERLTQRIAALEAENAKLRQQVEAMADGSEYTAMKARLKRLIDAAQERDKRIAELEEQLRAVLEATRRPDGLYWHSEIVIKARAVLEKGGAR